MNRANPTVRTFYAWQAGILRSDRKTRAPSAGGRLGGGHAKHHRHRAVRGHPRRRASACGQELRPAALRPYLHQMRLGADLLSGTCHHRQQCGESRATEDSIQACFRFAGAGACLAEAPPPGRGGGSSSGSGAAQRIERAILEHRLLRELGRQQLPGTQAGASPPRLGHPELDQPRGREPRTQG